ncbi:hypothetical protein SADUNF_Sadunf02G0054900 [Salix dunnii]|uniref:Uncharacterized protein n=1 Tax=Salix dunnii TaxID=1413687 RepID=A0A835N6F5_9ROSI|nr:hypothetical protein SADUNF_Sadunf02G0054900 [Salix dunnii]
MEMGHLKENLGFDGKLATMLRTPDLSPPDPEFHWRVLPRIKKWKETVNSSLRTGLFSVLESHYVKTLVPSMRHATLYGKAYWMG